MSGSQNNNLQNIQYNMDFRQRVKDFGFTGRPLRNNDYTKSYIKFIKNNPEAPVKQGDLFYRGKIRRRADYLDRRSNTGRLRPSVEREINEYIVTVSLREVTVDNITEMGTLKLSLTDRQHILSSFDSRGKNGILSDLEKMITIANRRGQDTNSRWVVKLSGTVKETRPSLFGADTVIDRDFNFQRSGNDILSIIAEMMDYIDEFTLNPTVPVSLSDITINSVELKLIDTSVGTGRFIKKKIKFDGFKLIDYNSKGKNNCFFWCISDEIKKHYKINRLTPERCNQYRALIGVKKDKMIPIKKCREFIKLIGANIYIMNRYGEDKGEYNSDNYDKTLFVLNNHIYTVEGKHERIKCKKCGILYFNKHCPKNCIKRQHWWTRTNGEGKKLVRPKKNFQEKENTSKYVLHYDIETETDSSPYNIHQPYIVGFTHYCWTTDKWIYGEFTGRNCMVDFVEYFRNVPKIKFLNAFNGDGFDHVFLSQVCIENEIEHEIKINNGRILELGIRKLTDKKIKQYKVVQQGRVNIPDGKWLSELEFKQLKEKNKRVFHNEREVYPYINTRDLSRHLTGTLNANLKGSGCKFQKGDIDHNLSVAWEDTDDKRRAEVRKYLVCDVEGLRELWEKYNNEFYDEYKINLSTYYTNSSMAYEIWKSVYLGKETCQIPNAIEDTFYRKSVYGGRCYPNKKSYTSKYYEDLIKGKISFDAVDDYLIDGDIKSLYPAVMTYQYPVGSAIETDKYIEGKMGIYEISFITNKKLLTSPLPRRDDSGRLSWDLKDGDGVYTSVDIERAKSVGYEITVHKGKYWEETAPLYKDYVLKMYEKKNNALKGTPRYNTCKILLNALYGKQIQKPIYTKQKSVKNKNQLLELIANNRIVSIMELNRVNWIITYEPINEIDINNTPSKPCQNGAFILAYSRDVMWKVFVDSGSLDNKKKLFHYTDTDSCQLHIDAMKNVKMGKRLGDLDNDLGDGCKIVKGIWIQPKLYMLKFIQKKSEVVKAYQKELKRDPNSPYLTNIQKKIDECGDRDYRFDTHYRGAGVPTKQLAEEKYDNMLNGLSEEFIPKFQMKRNLLGEKARLVVDGKVQLVKCDKMIVGHIKDTDVDVDGKLALNKVIASRSWCGRDFKSHIESYPLGYVY